jgi:hypothetical protein
VSANPESETRNPKGVPGPRGRMSSDFGFRISDFRWAALFLWAFVSCQSSPVMQSSLDRTVPFILEQDQIPSAVIVSGDVDRVTYARAFGDARLDTIYDLASCT